MRTSGLAVICYAAGATAHGYLKSIALDNTVYPGFDPHQDLKLKAKRIVYSWDPSANADGVGPVSDVTSPDIACNVRSTPPALVGKARAGSNMTFEWTNWVINHKGPITTYMAKYEGDIAKTDVNKLKFFKVAEDAVTSSGKWATDVMIAGGNKWNSTIPWDIKPGTYVIRHELLSLHFANGGLAIGPPGPQFYLACAAVDVEGSGTSEPAGETFPGAYKKDDPGLNFKLYPGDIRTSAKKGYVIAGPQLYKPTSQPPVLEPKPLKVISPMGDPAKDQKYYDALKSEAKMFGGITQMINNLPMGRDGFVLTPEMEKEMVAQPLTA